MALPALHFDVLDMSDLFANESPAQQEPQSQPAEFALDGSSAPNAGLHDNSIPRKPAPQVPQQALQPAPKKPMFKIIDTESDIEAKMKKDQHSKTKICCYSCCVFIPIALLVGLAMIIWFIITHKPDEGKVQICRHATGSVGGTDTLLICKEFWEEMCWKNTTLPESTKGVCESAGYYSNWTYSHDWKVNVTSVGTFVPLPGV